jgi:hypothetical protein
MGVNMAIYITNIPIWKMFGREQWFEPTFHTHYYHILRLSIVYIIFWLTYFRLPAICVYVIYKLKHSCLYL